MKRFVIDCGNSSIGPVGFVARVNAENKTEALELIREALPEYVEIGVDDPIEYFNVYLNGDGISIKDVEEDEDQDEEDEEEDDVQ